MGILDELKKASEGVEVDFKSLQEQAKASLTKSRQLTGSAKAEAQNYGINQANYQKILLMLSRNPDRVYTDPNSGDDKEYSDEKYTDLLSGYHKQIINDFRNAFVPIEKLKEDREAGQLAKRYGAYTPGSWLLHMNPGGEELEYNEDGTTYTVKHATTFVHELFDANKSKEQILEYFKNVEDWIGNDKELALSYMGLSNEEGKSIAALLEEKGKTPKYVGIYDVVLYRYPGLFPKKFKSHKIFVRENVNTHMASVHSSVDKSFVRLAKNYGRKAVDNSDPRSAKVSRSKDWDKRINDDISELKSTIVAILSSEDQLEDFLKPSLLSSDDLEAAKAEFKFKAATALRLIDNLESGERFGEYIVQPNEIQSNGLSVKEMVAIGYRSLDDKVRLENPEQISQHLKSFIENLYVAKRGYNIDSHGLEEWKTHEKEPDNNKCPGGCVNQFAQGLLDHKDVEVKIIDVSTMKGPLETKLPEIINGLAKENKSQINRWLELGDIPPELVPKLIDALQKDAEFSSEFSKDEISRIGEKVLRTIDADKLKDKLVEKYPEEFAKEVELKEKELLHSFVFDAGNDEREGLGYIPYLEKLFMDDREKAIDLIKGEIEAGFTDIESLDKLPKKVSVFYDFLLSSANKELCDVVGDQLQSHINKLGVDVEPETLSYFIMEGRAKIVEMLLEKVPYDDINAIDSHGWTALHYIAFKGKAALVEKLLEKMSPEAINATNGASDTALHIAVINGNTALVEKLLEKMSSEAINATNIDGDIALHLAAKKGHAALVEKLLEKMLPDVLNAKNYTGSTALNLAAQKGHTDIVEKLLERMSPEAINANDKHGQTALDYARKSENKKIIALIEDKLDPNKALIKACEENDLQRVKKVIKNGADPNAKDNEGRATALYVAAWYGHSDIVEHLLEKMSPEAINAQESYGWTALHKAAQSGRADVVEKLLERMSPEAINAQDFNGWTALHDAAHNGRADVVEKLLEKMSPEAINAKDKHGQSALHDAAHNGREDIVEKLLERMSPEAINAKDERRKCTALDYARKSENKKVITLIEDKLDPNEALIKACKENDLQRVKRVIKNGADPNAKDSYGNTALHIAVRNGRADIVEKLLEKMSPEAINANKDRGGDTALHKAAQYGGRTDIVEKLLEKLTPEAINATNGARDTALHLAAQYGRADIIEKLLEKMSPEAIKAIDNHGSTVLHIEAERGNAALVEKLLEKMSPEAVNAEDRYGDTALHKAAQNGREDIVEKLLEKLLEKMSPEAINAKNNKGRTALDYARKSENKKVITLIEDKLDPNEALIKACKENDLQRVKRVIKNGADSSTKDSHGNTALHILARYGRIDIVEYLLEKVSPEAVNAKDRDGDTALHIAAQYGRADIIEKLLEKMSPEAVNARGYIGRTALCTAATQNIRADIVEKLLEKMSPEAIKAKDRHGETALDYARKPENKKVITLIEDKAIPSEALIKACEENDLQRVKKVIKNGADPNAKDSYGNTALHKAAQNGRTDIVEKLLEKMSPEAVNAKDSYGNTALHLAAQNGRADIVEKLLEKLTPEAINAKDRDGDTALHKAAQNGRADIVEKLLEKMSPEAINATNGARDTALHIASQYGRTDIVEKLLEKLTPEAINATDVSGNTALHLAAQNGRADIVEKLLEKLTPEAINATNGARDTALHKAAQYGRTDIVEKLLEKLTPEAINATDVSGNTALHLAAQNGRADIVEKLLEKLTPEAINATNGARDTALHKAAQYGRTDIVEKLLEKLTPEAINATDVSGNTALHLAAQNGRADIVEKLLEKLTHEAINAKDMGGNTALHLAAQNGRADIVEKLLEKLTPEAINATNGARDTALHKAAQSGRADVVEKFLERMSPEAINAVDYKGWTALHIAARNGSADIVEKLLEKMSPRGVNAKDERRKCTALDYAKESENKKIITLIEEKLHPNKALINACKKNDIKKARTAIKNGADVDRKSFYIFGKTAMDKAIDKGDLEQIKMLAKKGAKTSGKNNAADFLKQVEAIKENVKGVLKVQDKKDSSKGLADTIVDDIKDKLSKQNPPVELNENQIKSLAKKVGKELANIEKAKEKHSKRSIVGKIINHGEVSQTEAKAIRAIAAKVIDIDSKKDKGPSSKGTLC